MAFKKEAKGRFGSKGRSEIFNKDFDDAQKFGKREKHGFESKSFGKGGARFNGSKPSFGKSNFELFDVECERCHKETQIPFKPTNGKPVYCRDCFNKNDGFDSKSSDRRGSSSGASSEDIREINKKLDKIMRALKID